MKKLMDICELVTSGQIMSRVALEEGKKGKSKPDQTVLETAKAVIPKAIAGGHIDDGELAEVQLIKLVDSNKRTAVGDIIVKLSTPYDSAVVASGQDNLIATSFCALIKGLSSDYLPEFVCAYLNTQMMKDKLKASTSGSTIPLLRVGDLKLVEIPEIDITKQRQAVDAISLNAQRRKLYEAMLEQCDVLEESIIMTVIEKEAQDNG